MKLVRFARLLTRPHPKQSLCFRSLNTEPPIPFENLPGLTALPVIGTIHHFLPLVGSVGIHKNMFEMFNVMKKKFGPIVKWEGMFNRGTIVIFFDQKDFEKIYRSEETNPTRPGFQALEYYREVLHKEKFNGIYGLSTAQGQNWRDFRTKVNPALLKRKLVQLYTPGLEDIAEDSIARLLKMSSEALSKDFDAEITKWSLESVALVALGSRIGCLDENAGEDHPGQKLIYCAKNVAELAFKLEFSPAIWKKDKSKTANFKKILEVFDLQWDVSAMYINQAKKKIEERGYEIPEEDQSVLEKLLAIDDKVATMMANEMLLAGIDTVAFSITGLLYQLAANQDAQDKVRQEIRQHNGSRYLKACLKESLRLAPVIPANLRQTSKEHVVRGYHIPKGIFAIAPHEVLSKSEENYTRATEFLPERWMVEKSDPLHSNSHPMTTLPFGFGIRSCIGRRIAEMEMEIFVTKLLDKVKITWTGPPIQVITKLMNTYKKPYHFKFEPIN